MTHIINKTIIVTGAGGGFGRLVCSKAARAGANVVGIDVNEGALLDSMETVHKDNPTALFLKGDVTQLADLQAAVARAVEAFGSLDIMINNAGTMPLAFYRDHVAAADAWNRCIDINIKGVLNGIIAVHDQMIRQGRGHVINVSSIYGNFPVAGAAVYGATKTAVNFLSEVLRVESQGKIKVTTIKPTGVPATGLGTGVINDEAVTGILGQNTGPYLAQMAQLAEGKATLAQLDPDNVQYLALDPEYIADAILTAIDQPWGVSLGDITIRATGDGYIL